MIVYHLIHPETTNTAGVYHDVRIINEQKELSSLKRLQRLSKKVNAEFQQISISTVVDRKPVVSNILKFAKENQTDLIVMGTQGASGLQKVTVGSVAAKVLSRSGNRYYWCPKNMCLLRSGTLYLPPTLKKLTDMHFHSCLNPNFAVDYKTTKKA